MYIYIGRQSDPDGSQGRSTTIESFPFPCKGFEKVQGSIWRCSIRHPAIEVRLEFGTTLIADTRVLTQAFIVSSDENGIEYIGHVSFHRDVLKDGQEAHFGCELDQRMFIYCIVNPVISMLITKVRYVSNSSFDVYNGISIRLKHVCALGYNPAGGVPRATI